MARATLVRRIIEFLRGPDAESEARRESVQAMAEYEEEPAYYPSPGEQDRSPEAEADAETQPQHPLVEDDGSTPYYASRLDALLLRAVQQFNARAGYVLRCESAHRLRYCTGRTMSGRYIAHDEIDADQRAIMLALESGEAQVFVHRGRDNVARTVLCGPLWEQDVLVGLLYLESPARSRLHRAVFDVFCNQTARLLGASTL